MVDNIFNYVNKFKWKTTLTHSIIKKGMVGGYGLLKIIFDLGILYAKL